MSAPLVSVQCQRRKRYTNMTSIIDDQGKNKVFENHFTKIVNEEFINNPPNDRLKERINPEQRLNDEYWTTSAIIDELISQLSSASVFIIDEDTGTIRIKHKYYDQAEFCLYRINIWKISPVFVINCSDLSKQLQNELEQLKNSDPRLFDKTVTEAIQSLMEGVNQRHVSGTAFKVSWRFED